jgi:hypothetical protein
MNKKTIERIAVFALAAFFVGYFAYQVAYGTNESSYKIGYNTAVDNYTNLITVNPDNTARCDTQDGCPQHDDAQKYCLSIGSGVTNATACIDGYVNGWKHWCSTDLKMCANMVMGDTFPGSLVTDNKTALNPADNNTNITATVTAPPGTIGPNGTATVIRPNGTATVTGPNGIWGRITTPPGTTGNLTIVPDNQSNINDTFPPPTINFTAVPYIDHYYYNGIKESMSTLHLMFTITAFGKTYKGYDYNGSATPNLILCAHYKDTLKDDRFTHRDCVTLTPSS